MDKKYIWHIVIDLVLVLVGVFLFWVTHPIFPWRYDYRESGRTEYLLNQLTLKVSYTHPSYPVDYSQDTLLLGVAHNVFIGKVLAQASTNDFVGHPATQFTVEVVKNIKGDLKDTVTVNQEGGVKDGTLYLMEDSIGLLAPGAGDWDGLRVESGASSTLKYASVRYGGNTVTGSSKMVWNNGGIVSIENTEIATSSSYGVFTNSGTTAVTLSGLHGNTYGACVTGGVFSIRSSQLYLNSGYGVCNTTGVDMHGEYNYWGASDGPSGQGPGTGDAVSINVLFTNWLAIPHFLHLSTSSGQLVSSVNVFDNIDWHFLGTTTSYTAAWYGAVDTWNNEGPIEIATSTYWWTADVVIEDIATSSSDLFVAQYRPQSITPDEIVFNPYFMNQYNSLPAMQQNAATHELGHALGLGHSYLGNIMNLYDTTQTTLGDQDKSDYHYWWGY